jgi:sugar (pentulose or hexulose) kinase
MERTAIDGSIGPPGRLPRRVLALDCGSTLFKGALFDATGGCLAEAALPIPYLSHTGAGGDPGGVELDPEAVWQVTLDLILTLCRQAEVPPGAVDCIALTSQAQTFALLDAMEQPLTPFISWLDTRAGPEILVEIDQHLGRDFHAHCSFSPPLAELQLAKLLWLRRHAPGLVDRARNIVSLPSYLALRLAGINALDPNLAAMSGLYSLRDGDWWPEALALCGVTAVQLPALVPMGRRLRARRPCPELDLSASLEIVFAGNDQTSGAFGNGCRPGDRVVTLGTALVAYRVAGPDPGPYSPTGCWGPYPGTDPSYYELAVLTHGCLALDWAREQLLPGQPVEAFMALASSAVPRGQAAPRGQVPVFFFPERMGTGAAFGPAATGEATLPGRALAVLEGIGFALRRLLRQTLGSSENLRFSQSIAAEVIAVGGGSRSDFWLHLLADILSCPVRRGTGNALTGACRMATLDIPGFAACDLLAATEARAFHPDPARVELYRALYADWCKQERRLD